MTYADVLKMIKRKSAVGLPMFEDCSMPLDVCKTCALGKMHRLKFKTGRERATELGQLIHSDVCGPLQVQSAGGEKYFVSFKDDFSGWTTINFLKQKSDV